MNHTITSINAREVLVDCQDQRGCTLAESLGGRITDRGFILTPARAKQWECLYLSEWEAVRGKRLGMTLWVYRSPFRRKTYLLRRAMKELEAVQPAATC